VRRIEQACSWAVPLLVAFAVASLANAMPGAISSHEAAVVRAAVTGETIVIETQGPELPRCSGSLESCKFDDDVADSYRLANQRRGYIECKLLSLAYERCVRRRQLPRTMFRGFPAVVFSRPGFSADGKTALVHRTQYTSAQHGSHSWIFLVREGEDAAWRVRWQQLVGEF